MAVCSVSLFMSTLYLGRTSGSTKFLKFVVWVGMSPLVTLKLRHFTPF